MVKPVVYDDVFDAQADFRIIIDSMARPGKINVLAQREIYPPENLSSGSASIALALLNNDVSFYSSDDKAKEISEFVVANTGAGLTPVNHADFIFINGLHDASIVNKAKTGTLSYPEESATFIIDVSQISDQPINDSTQLTLKGPGIETIKVVYIKGINEEILQEARNQNAEFPLGIDLMLVDNSNNLLCIPRSNQFAITIN